MSIPDLNLLVALDVLLAGSVARAAASSCGTAERFYAPPRSSISRSGPNVHAAEQGRLRGKFRTGADRARRRGRAAEA
jgi:hypothetical protein